jgi:hypothetical protein
VRQSQFHSNSIQKLWTRSAGSWSLWREIGSTNSQRHHERLFYGDYYLNILAYCQDYLIQHDYQSLYLNSYHMNWNSTKLYYMICVYAICMFKFCINTILSNVHKYNLYLYSLYLYPSLTYRQEYLIYHDHRSNHLVTHLEQRHNVGCMNSCNQMNSCHHCYYVLYFWRSEGGKQ